MKTNTTKAIQAPKLPLSYETVKDFDSLITQDPYIQGYHFHDMLISMCKEPRIHFDGCLFQNVDFEECEFENIDLLDCRFENCDLSNCKFLDGALHRLVFQNCRMMGCDFGGSVLKNITFAHVNARYANYSTAKLSHIHLMRYSSL